MQDFYSDFGIDRRVSSYCGAILAPLASRFDAIDAVAEQNQAKVLLAMQKNRVDAACFAGSTGYGYNDAGRDTLERVYAHISHRVRPRAAAARLRYARAGCRSERKSPARRGASLPCREAL